MIHTTHSLTREEVCSIAVPERDNVSSRWQGVPHRDLLTSIFDSAEQKGLKPLSERYETQHEGNDLFGVIDFETPRNIVMPEGTQLSLGFRHSNLSHYAITFAVGGRVLVCSNGMILGEFIVKRKHTTGADVPELVDAGLNRFLDEAKNINDFTEALKNTRCRDQMACRYIIEAGRQEVLPWAQLDNVQRLWFEPEHEEFDARNRWSLYNAFTEVVRDRKHAAMQMKELRSVGEFILDPLGQSAN